MKTIVIRYRVLIIVLLAVGISSIFDPPFARSVTSLTFAQLKEMLLVIPPIFILLGLLDSWVPKEVMVRYMGEGSGVKGVVLAFLIGSAAAGPLYGAFPVAAVFMKKGVKFRNILIFIGAWSTTKIPMLLFEISSLGARFALTRLLVDIPGIIIIAHLLSLLISKEDVRILYERAELK
ncbi:MAG: permease [Spirochaetia bacterium]|nr:permease [Spirochaetia bacterium]